MEVLARMSFLRVILLGHLILSLKMQSIILAKCRLRWRAQVIKMPRPPSMKCSQALTIWRRLSRWTNNKLKANNKIRKNRKNKHRNRMKILRLESLPSPQLRLTLMLKWQLHHQPPPMSRPPKLSRHSRLPLPLSTRRLLLLRRRSHFPSRSRIS